MKKFLPFIILTFTIFIAAEGISFSQDATEFRPTQPPRVPVTDYDTGPHRIADFLYMHYSFEEFTLDGGALGFNYVDRYEQIAYNFGGGVMYMQASSSSLPEELDIYVAAIPLNANIGYRLIGNADTHNLMVFGGLHWMYMWFVAVYGVYDVYVYGPAFGPLAGLKGEIKLTPSVSIIPYYAFQHTIFDLTVEVEGIAQDVDIDPVTSHLFGFDVKFGEFSVGALLDALNNTDNNKITIMFSYDFDYKSGNEDLNRGDVKPADNQRQKQTVKKKQ